MYFAQSFVDFDPISHAMLASLKFAFLAESDFFFSGKFPFPKIFFHYTRRYFVVRQIHSVRPLAHTRETFFRDQDRGKQKDVRERIGEGRNRSSQSKYLGSRSYIDLVQIVIASKKRKEEERKVRRIAEPIRRPFLLFFPTFTRKVRQLLAKKLSLR